jgi:hypothetical protein
MNDRSAKFKIGLASTASRRYEVEPNGAAAAIDFGYAASAILCEALALPVFLTPLSIPVVDPWQTAH